MDTFRRVIPPCSSPLWQVVNWEEALMLYNFELFQ